VAEHKGVQQELAKLRDQVQTLRENAQRTVKEVGETQTSLGRNLQRLHDLVNQLEDRIHELEAEVAEAHQGAREMRRHASGGPTAAEDLPPLAPIGAGTHQPPQGAPVQDRRQAGSSGLASAVKEQEQIQEQMVQTLAELRKVLGELENDLRPQ
jgi:chromosome segregation ATPase